MSYPDWFREEENQPGPRIHIVTLFADMKQNVLGVFRNQENADAMLETLRSAHSEAAFLMSVKSMHVSDNAKREVWLAFIGDDEGEKYLSYAGATKEEIGQKVAKKWNKKAKDLIWKGETSIVHGDPGRAGYIIEKHTLRSTGPARLVPNLFVVAESNDDLQDTIDGVFKTKAQAVARLQQGKTKEDSDEIKIKEFHISDPSKSKVLLGFHKGYDMAVLTFAESTKEKLSHQVAADWGLPTSSVEWVSEDLIDDARMPGEAGIEISEYQIE